MKSLAKPFRFTVRVSLALGISSSLQAADIVSYDFEAASLDNPTTEASNTSSSAMTGAGWTSGGSASFGRSSAGNYFGRGPGTTTGTSWVGFTMAADSGYTIDLTQLDFDYYVQQEDGGSAGGTFTFEVRSSVDGFASAMAGTYSLNPAGATAPYQGASFDLSGGSYDGLASIEFRFYATSDDGNERFNDIVRWDNITVAGAVTSTGPDLDPPTLIGITDDHGGASVGVTAPVTYTVEFSEDIDESTLSAADFANAGSSSVNFGAITETSPGTFTVVVTPTTVGTLQLGIPTTADIRDPAGNQLDSDPALLDDTTITVTAADTTPPSWIPGWPQVDGVTSTGATARARIDELGTAFFVVVASAASAPSSAQVRDGNDAGDSPAIASGSIAQDADTEATAAITGLAPGTAYDVYFVAEDDGTTPNLQPNPAPVIDITTAAADTTPPAWIAGWPLVDGVTTTSATARARIDEVGTAFFVVVADADPVPSSIQVRAGNNSSDSPAIATGSIALGTDTENAAAIIGLAPGTTYDVYFVAEDGSANLQTAPAPVIEITTQTAAPTLVFYDFGAASLDNPTTEASNTSSSAMTGAGWTSGGSASFGRSSAGNYFGRGPSTTVGTSWVGFTMTADSGYTIDLSQLDFDYYVQQEDGGSTGGSFTFEVRSSVDGFASAIAGTYSLNPAGTTAPYQDAAFDLSGGSYDGLSSIEFRLYATSDDGNEKFNDIVRWADITVSGSVTSGGGGGTFAGWIDGWELDEADKDFSDDPDGDNLVNGIEAFFGTSPAAANQGLVQVSKSGSLFSFQHSEADPALNDVTGSYEWSIDLQGWHPEGTVGDTTVTISASKGDPQAGTTTVTADTTGSTTAPAKLFLRVVATQGT